MYKTFSNICITLALGILILFLVKPALFTTATNTVLGTYTERARTISSGVVAGKIQQLIPSSISSYLHTIQPVGTAISVGGTNDTALTTNNILDATNRERIAAGLSPLKLNPKLVESAHMKTEDMITKQYFEHISPTGESVSDLGDTVGYRYVIMGENLALGNFMDGDDVLAAWMASPGHRANILNPNYQEIGVYAAKALYQGREVWFAVQHFGTDRTVCPMISSTLKSSIDAINTELKQRQAHIANDKAFLEGPNHPEGEEYKTAVSEFNSLVAEYNTALVISQEKIKAYNQQVAAFNTCLAQYQSKV